jgi:hypothetical protein
MGGVQPAGPPFRWDLVPPDQLGSLLAGQTPPDLWFAEELVVAAGKVTARSGGGDLYFSGHSADSVFDLLGGAFAGTDHARRLHRLAFSPRWEDARGVLEAAGITPCTLARSHRIVAFVDLISPGGTFEDLYRTLRTWVADAGEPWPVIRRKLRFVGLTGQVAAWRSQQTAGWAAELPPSAVITVSIGEGLSDYLGTAQTKLTRSSGPAQWSADEAAGQGHDDRTRAAVAEAVALVALGQSRPARSLLARTMAAEPAYAESWLRTLVRQLN